jgi:hypothetical protein
MFISRLARYDSANLWFQHLDKRLNGGLLDPGATRL